MMEAMPSMATSCRMTRNSCYTVLKPLKTILQTVEIFHLTLNQLFSKQHQYTEKKDSKTSVFNYMNYTIGCKD